MLVSLRNVSKIYPMGEENIFALNGINLDLEAGEFVSIIGSSGSGKSTLLNVIGGLDRPTQGDVFFQNEALSAMSDKKLSFYRNRNIGFIFQMFNLEPTLTAEENVALPLMLGGASTVEAKHVAKELLSWLGLGNRLLHKPNSLSGGQRQKVAIARALSNRPKVILADEPTGNLDSRSSQEILNILSSLNKKLGVTLILVTHSLEAAYLAPRVLKMQDGSLIN